MSMLRRWTVPIGVLAALLLLALVNPWFEVEGTVRTVATIGFWALFLILLVVLFMDRGTTPTEEVEITGPAFVRYLFHHPKAGLFWLPIRLFVGFSWVEAGWHKFTDPEWTQGGAALLGYWERAVAIPEQGRPAITFEWYRDFLNVLIDNNAAPWFAWVVTLGELAIGLGLIFGMLTGIAAFFGALMNMSFLLAGSGSSNPVLFTLAVGLMLAWRVAGYYGLDRYVLPALGAPWAPGAVFRRERAASTA
jgi:thiosulfate dehydrogenase [quinone] large subunit